MRAAAVCIAETPGRPLISTRAQSAFALTVDQLEHQGRHGIDAGIAGADQRHVTPLGGETKGDAHAHLLLAQLIAVPRLVFGQRPQQIEIELVADQVRRLADGCLDLVRACRRRAGSDADDSERAAGAADEVRINKLC